MTYLDTRATSLVLYALVLVSPCNECFHGLGASRDFFCRGSLARLEVLEFSARRTLNGKVCTRAALASDCRWLVCLSGSVVDGLTSS